jgi:hypothetical protein
MLSARKNATKGTSDVGSPRLLVRINDWLDLPLESEERPGQLLELVASVINLVAEYALSHGQKYSTLFGSMPK